MNPAGATISIPTTTETTIFTHNAVRTPFQNGKIMLWGCIQLTVGTGTTTINVRVRRNASAENVLLPGGNQNITVIAGNVVLVPYCTFDQVPDGRDCLYSVSILQNGATANGSAAPGSTGCAVVLSG